MHAITNRAGVTYYYFDTGSKPRYLPLGKDYVEAVQRWAEHSIKPKTDIFTLESVVNKYRIEVMPGKAIHSQKDFEYKVRYLLDFFGADAKIDDIKPMHIRQFREWRPAKVSANREISLFSHMWNMAKEWGITDQPNPCAGIRRNKEESRTTYITDEEFALMLKHADPALADAMEIAYYTGQRPADVLKIRETDIRDGCIEIRQNKTKAALRINIVGRLAEVITRCRKRKSGTIYSTSLITGSHGKPLSVSWIGQLWRKAKTAAGIKTDIQFRDIRAKAVSDKEEMTDIRDAQQLAGHAHVSMTERYSRKRRGQKIDPIR